MGMADWEELIVTYDETEAEIIKDILEGEGIESVINSLKIRPYPVSIGRIGEIRIMVPADRLAEAKKLLDIMSKKPENNS